MSNQRLTQCPHCKASFKVSEEQLSAANGRVRCGACMNIFDAIAYSLSELDNEHSKNELPEELAADHDEILDLEESILESQDQDLFADNPEEDKEEAGYSGSKTPEDEFSTSFLELDKESDNEADLYSTSFQNLDEDFIDAESQEAVDESWTENILNDIQETKNDTKIEPSLGEESLSFDEPPENIATNLSPSNAGHADNVQQYEKIDFQYQQDSDPKNRHWLSSLFFIVANLTLLAALLVQAVWFHYEKLVKYPQVAQLYQLACEQLSCTLPKLEDVSKIKSNNLVVRSHPARRKSLIIDTVINNEASFEQDFPDLGLYFSDINKKVIAQRLINPREYLSGELASWTKMPIDQPIHISLEIIDPGKEAVNYSLKFFPAKQ